MRPFVLGLEPVSLGEGPRGEQRTHFQHRAWAAANDIGELGHEAVKPPCASESAQIALRCRMLGGAAMHCEQRLLTSVFGNEGPEYLRSNEVTKLRSLDGRESA